jgi:hypothetical protein
MMLPAKLKRPQYCKNFGTISTLKKPWQRTLVKNLTLKASSFSPNYSPRGNSTGYLMLVETTAIGKQVQIPATWL